MIYHSADQRRRLLPLVNVFALAEAHWITSIKVIGRAAIEAVLDISAAEVTSEKQPGKERKGVDVAYHGWQRGRVYLPDRAVRVEKPRLRNPGAGKVVIPAYEALRRPSGLGERMLAARQSGTSSSAATMSSRRSVWTTRATSGSWASSAGPPRT